MQQLVFQEKPLLHFQIQLYNSFVIQIAQLELNEFIDIFLLEKLECFLLYIGCFSPFRLIDIRFLVSALITLPLADLLKRLLVIGLLLFSVRVTHLKLQTLLSVLYSNIWSKHLIRIPNFTCIRNLIISIITFYCFPNLFHIILQVEQHTLKRQIVLYIAISINRRRKVLRLLLIGRLWRWLLYRCCLLRYTTTRIYFIASNGYHTFEFSVLIRPRTPL